MGDGGVLVRPVDESGEVEGAGLSKCNDKIRAELADQIPDVTGRRFNSYLVESNGQKDATAYGLQISPENIELPQILLDLCKPVETGAVHRWREV